MRKIAFGLLLTALTACGGEDKPAEEVLKNEPLTQSQNSEAFNTSFANVLNNYYHLKDALILSNADLANTSAKLLAGSADSIALAGIKADSSIVDMARGYVQTVSSESNTLTSKADIEGKRKSFQMISDAMYDLVRTVHYDNGVVYHAYCPMAFNDAGAYWLSSSADIKNPYFGKKMLTCGEIKNSVDFRGK